MMVLPVIYEQSLLDAELFSKTCWASIGRVNMNKLFFGQLSFRKLMGDCGEVLLTNEPDLGSNT